MLRLRRGRLGLIPLLLALVLRSRLGSSMGLLSAGGLSRVDRGGRRLLLLSHGLRFR